MPILEATFDPAWAAVRLIIDGGMWPTAVDRITITRSTPDAPAIPVRGMTARAVVGGYFVGTDHEAPLGSTVTYRVDGYLGAVFVVSATVTVTTSGAADGLWVKVAGAPDLTMRCDVEAVGDADSPTIGGVYQIAGGGGAVSQTSAQWSGIASDSQSVGLRVEPGIELSRLRAVLSAARVLLVQGVGVSDVDPGWYFVADATRSNPGQSETYPYRSVTLALRRTGIPAGVGSGIAGWSWAAVKDTYPTWTALMAAKATWFDVLKGL